MVIRKYYDWFYLVRVGSFWFRIVYIPLINKYIVTDIDLGYDFVCRSFRDSLNVCLCI